MTFLEKYDARAEAVDSLLCVSLDPDFEKLPERLRADKHPLFSFNRSIIDATHPLNAAYKLNIAFYEARGAAGIEDLALTVEYLRKEHGNIPLICDAKRGDVENTNEQYAKALFDEWGFDAATVNPYLGGKALQSFLGRKEKGIIVLCRTSNPGAGEFQDLRVEGKPLWQVVAERVRDEWNANGNCSLVSGATYPEELRTLRSIMGEMTFLVPGIGRQGGDLEAAVKAGLNSKGKGLIVVASRSVIFAEDPAGEARRLRDAINAVRRTQYTEHSV